MKAISNSITADRLRGAAAIIEILVVIDGGEPNAAFDAAKVMLDNAGVIRAFVGFGMEALAEGGVP